MEQTNRTILFEEINPNKINLLTLVNESGKKESLTDEEVLKIHQHLEVKSFQEFLSKFTPEVYMLLDTCNRKVMFSREYIEDAQDTLCLNNQDSLFNMLLYLMEAKQNKKYLLMNFSDLLEHMLPEKDTKSFLKEKNAVVNNLVKQTNVNFNDANWYINELLHKYDDGILLLRAFLEEVTAYLPYMGKEIKIDRGILDDEGRMQIKVIESSSEYRDKVFIIEKTDIVAYEEMIISCLREVFQTKPIKHMTLYKDLLMLPILFANKEYRTIQEKYTEYCDLYENVIKKFWLTAKPLIETMLGIKKYFEQYRGQEGMSPALLVCNFQASDILMPQNREKLEIYLRSVNDKMFYQNTIWYSIIPNLASGDHIDAHTIRERFKAKKERIQYQRTEMEAACVLLELTSRYKIQNFLSLAVEEESTFTAFAKKGIDSINDSFAVLDKVDNKDYIIPCFPNFTVMIAEDACLCIGTELEFDDLTEQIVSHGDRNLWLDELGIEASYVAAGLVAACQCPQFLKSHFKRGINMELPGVAYRFTEGGNNLITVSNMLSETIEYSSELFEDAIQKSKGLLFGQKNGKMLVLTDRVFSYTTGNPLSISMVQTINYIERVIRYETQDFKKNLINQFFQKRPGSIISSWFMDDKSAINAILKENEKIDYEVDDVGNECTFSIYFNNSDLLKREKVSIFIE